MKKITFLNVITVAIALSLGQVVVHFITHQDWHVAIERSFFQFVALLTLWITADKS